MGCNCGKNRQQWQVVTTAGKVAYTGSVKSVVDNVAKRYPGSTVKPVGKTTAKT